MKKMLLGLGAVSTIVLAAPAYNDPKPDSTVWQTGEGKIDVTGTLTATPAGTKYVVFASTDEGKSDVQDTLILKPFVMSQEAESAIFNGTNPKVYVKRVNGSNDGFVDLDPSDTVKFKLTRTPGFSDTTAVSNIDWFGQGDTVEIVPTLLLNDDQIENWIDGLSNLYLIDGMIGQMVAPQGPTYYKGAKNIGFKCSENGILEILSVTATIPAKSNLPSKSITKVEEKLAQADLTGSAISIKVKVE